MNGKAFYTSKTFWFNVLFLVVGIASAFGYVDFAPGPEIDNYILVGVTVVNVVLRFLTDKPIFVAGG